jgi:hypothetical protein
MRRHFFLLQICLLLSYCNCVLAQEEGVIDSVALQKRIDSEISAFQEWRDSMSKAKGYTLPEEQKKDNLYPGSKLPTAEELQESERKLSQFKRIITWLFVLVMLVGVLLSKPWKKTNR